jgi:hypothetical protein
MKDMQYVIIVHQVIGTAKVYSHSLVSTGTHWHPRMFLCCIPFLWICLLVFNKLVGVAKHLKLNFVQSIWYLSFYTELNIMMYPMLVIAMVMNTASWWNCDIPWAVKTFFLLKVVRVFSIHCVHTHHSYLLSIIPYIAVYITLRHTWLITV